MKVLPRLAVAASLALAASPVVLPTPSAHAQSASDLEAAKKAFKEGKELFDDGKYDKAVEKFKESYKLSKLPALLFNIALTFEKLGQNDMALFYYKKFLSDAPENNPQRPDAEKAIAEIELAQEVSGGTGDRGGGGDKGTGDKGTGDKGTGDKGGGTQDVGTGDKGGTGETEKPVKPVKPKRDECLLEDFQHEMVDEAPPGKPLDLSAFVSEDATCEVILYFRASGEDKFTTETMKPRYNELVARIPAAKMSGNAVQYYIEVKNSKGELVTRIGKATSPNVVFIDEAAKARYYPDLDDGNGSNAATDTRRHDEDDDPLHGGHKRIIDDEEPVRHEAPPPQREANGQPEGGFFDAGSKKFGYAKWSATGLAGTGVVLSITFALMSSSWASSIEGEAATSNSENCTGGPPCRTYDDYRKGLEATGERYETMSQVFFGVGLIGIGIAGYYWYEELFAHRGEKSSTVTAAPILGDDTVGAAASLRW